MRIGLKKKDFEHFYGEKGECERDKFRDSATMEEAK
jgi:hypothetical protein